MAPSPPTPPPAEPFAGDLVTKVEELLLKLEGTGSDQTQIMLLPESINAINGTVYIPPDKTVLIRAMPPLFGPAGYSGGGGGGGRRLSTSPDWSSYPPRPLILGNGLSPLFRVDTRATLMLSNVILSHGRGGSECGGGVVVIGEGKVVAQHVEFSDNTANQGGAICVQRTGRLRLYNVDFINNHATTSVDAGVGQDIYLLAPKEQYGVSMHPCSIEQASAVKSAEDG